MGSGGISRGALIVFEGVDRCGKSTQSARLVKHLTSQNIPVEHIVFPNRGTKTGRIINDYLTNKNDLSDEAIHNLFADNRRELHTHMQELLLAGKSLIVDRYSYSGVAYTAAKGLDFDWCKSSEVGLLKPDLVIYLVTEPEKLHSRGNYGEERYERVEFQKKVLTAFERIYEAEKDYWKKIDACQDVDTIQKIVAAEVEATISNVKTRPLEFLWK